MTRAVPARSAKRRRAAAPRAAEATTEQVAGPPSVTATAERARALPAWLRAASPVPTYVGAVVVALGFGVIALGWGAVAGEASVDAQIPHLVLLGLGGLAVVLLGLAILNVSIRRRDAAARVEQIAQLTQLLGELRTVLDDPKDAS